MYVSMCVYVCVRMCVCSLATHMRLVVYVCKYDQCKDYGSQNGDALMYSAVNLCSMYMCVCVYVCMICMYDMCICMICMYVCMYVCMICMYVCMYV
jgi:hypothetical protein